jgi:hypothetical protein
MTALDWITNGLVAAAVIAVSAIFWLPGIRSSRLWRAALTPLASIIGSGFLVVAPLLAHTVGNAALFAMLGIVALAYAVGSAVRYNICHVEAISEPGESGDDALPLYVWLERLAKLALAFAYIIAITFYLEILGAFVLRLFEVQNQDAQKLIATALLVFIGSFGFWRGLRQLESLEKYSVHTKLAIIAGFLVGLAIVNIHDVVTHTWRLAEMNVEWNTETLRKLLGAFLIVQGFETSRYLGAAYSAEERVTTMRYAQLLSAAIYIVFVGLASILFGSLGTISETGIISLSSQVAVIVPFLLIVGAAMAQFSAAVADTLASGGLVESATNGAVNNRVTYLAVVLLAAGLLWSSHIFAIIAYASRAFAFYYAIQCAMAALHSRGDQSVRSVFFWLLSVIMILTAIFGIPAESVDA